MPRSINSRYVLYIFIFLLVTISPMAGQGHRRADTATEILLDFNPFTDPLSINLHLNGDGSAQLVRYSRYRLEVATINAGHIPVADLHELISARRSDIAAAFRRRSFGGEGAERGDQFYLSIRSAELSGECAGYIDDTPAGVRTLIPLLIELADRLPPAARAPAYVRGEPIERKRKQILLRAGRLRFNQLTQFPSDLQSSLRTVIANPRVFQAVSNDHYNQLLKYATHGHELFVIDQERGYQLTLFATGPDTSRPRRHEQ